MPRTATGLYVPSHIDRYDLDATERHNAEVDQMIQRFEGTMRYWTEVIQRELDDPRLEVIFAPPYASAETGLEPGRYHVMRRNEPPTPPTLIPLEGTRGEFVEPGQWVVDLLRRSDLQNPRVMADHREAKRRLEMEKRNEQQRETEERREHLRDAYKSRFETSISFNRDNPWTQNVAGKRGGAR